MEKLESKILKICKFLKSEENSNFDKILDKSEDSLENLERAVEKLEKIAV